MVRPPLSYLFALLASLLALGLKHLLDPVLGRDAPFLVFFAAVTLSAWNGGLGPGLFSAAISSLLTLFYFVGPVGSLPVDSFGWLRGIAFFLEGTLISLLASARRQAQEGLLRRGKQQEALASLSQEALRGPEDVIRLCNRACELCVQTLNGSFSTVLTLDDAGKVLTIRGSHGWPQGSLEGIQLDTDAETQAGYTIRTCEPVIVPDLKRETRFKVHPKLLEAGTRSSVTVIIGSPDKSFGVLALHCNVVRGMSPDEISFLQAVANVLAVALERMRSEASRALSEERLRRSELRYRTFFEQSTEAIWRFELDVPIPVNLNEDELIDRFYEYGYLAECNDAFARLYGYNSRDQLIGARLGDLLIRTDPNNEAYLRAFIQSGFRLSDAESKETDRYGNVVEFSNTLLGIIEDDRLVRAWGTQRDITEEKQAAAKLRASEERFRSLFESAPLGTAILRDGKVLYANLAEARLYGVDRPEILIGRSIWEFIVPEDHDRLGQQWAPQDTVDKMPAMAEGTAFRRDGSRFQFQAAMASIELPDGPAVLAFTMDVTEQKLAEAKVRASEERFRALFDAAPIPIAITRMGKILYANAATVSMLGFDSAVDLVGRNTLELLVPEQRERMIERVERRSQGQSEAPSYEVTGIRSDGTRFPVRIEVAQLDLPDGPATLAFAFDLTLQKRIEAERLVALERERRAATRALRLQEITAALAGAATVEEVGDIVINLGVPASGAYAGSLSLPEGDELHVLRAAGYPRSVIEHWSVIKLDDPLPVTEAWRKAQPVWGSEASRALADNEEAVDTLSVTGTRSIAAIPLIANERSIGVLSLSFALYQVFDEDDRAFLLTLAGQCAQGLERVRALEEARAAARHQRESLALLDTLLDSAPVGFAFFDNRGRFVLLNDALARTNGIAAEEHVGRSLTEVLPQMDPQMDAMLRRVLETGQPSGETELLGVTPASPGETRHWLASVYPVLTGEDQMLGAGAVIMEITERVRAEQERLELVAQLETERARFEATLRQMPSAVLIGEAPTGNIVLENEQVQRLLRRPIYGTNALSGENVKPGSAYYLDGTPLGPDDWPLARALQKGEVVTGEEVAITRGDGSTGVIRLNAAPIRDRDGHISAGVVIFDDVTERSRADAAQRFLAEAGSALVASLEERDVLSKLASLCVPRVADWCIVAIPNEDGLVHDPFIAHADADKAPMAQRFRRQWTFDPRVPWDIEGAVRSRRAQLYASHELDDLSRSQASPEFVEIIQAIGARSAIVSPLVARGRVVGVMIWITAESNRVYDEKDLVLVEELSRRTALTADNTRLFRESRVARDEAQTALEEARTARDEAENANRAKDEFLAVVSHELRTPLTPIMGWIELLRGANVPEETRQQAYEVIERNARSQAQLVNDVLDVSRITTGKLRLDIKVLPLTPVVETAIESLRNTAVAKRIELRTTFEDVGEARFDVTRVTQVVWNLLQNAIKFTPEGGNISVDLHRRGKYAILRVADSGVGIPQDFLPHVFEQFRQADSSATRPAGGLGLGLAIVRHIMDMHGGEVVAESAGENLGSVFTVTLPLEVKVDLPPPELDLNGNGYQPLPQLPAGLRLLVVDDEPDTRSMLAHLLTLQGAMVRQADSGSAALRILQDEDWRPDVIVSDVGMPYMDGYELRRRLKEMLPNVPAIALTAYAAPSDQRRALEAGFDRYLSKPVDPINVVHAVIDLAAQFGDAGK